MDDAETAELSFTPCGSTKGLAIAFDDMHLKGELRLALFAIGDRGGVASVDAVAEWCRTDRDAATSLVQGLEEAGYLVRARVHGAIALVNPAMVEPVGALPKAPPQWAASPAKRARILARDGGKCHYCGSSHDLGLDHIVPRSRGGAHDDDNLITCCRSCNTSKGTKSYWDFVSARVAS
jgi:hypothetical protein